MQSSKGFTLIEIAIVTIVVGLLSIPMFHAYNMYLVDKRMQETRDHISEVQSLMANFLISHKRYPCPADASLPPTDPNYGVERCEFTGIVGAPAPYYGSATLAINTCTINTALCRVQSTRTISGAMQPVMIGAVPIKTMIFDVDLVEDQNDLDTNQDISLDGWGNKLRYAINENMTWEGTYSMLDGAINVITESNRDIGGRPMADPTYFHYALLSHGPDGVGAYTEQGERVDLCTSGIYGEPGGPPPDADNPPGTTAMKDVLNCDMNATFLSSLNNLNSINSANHYDDVLTFATSESNALWEYLMVGGAKTEHIRNINQGFVGISTDPTTELDVGVSEGSTDGLGDIRAETQVRAPAFCTKSSGGAECFVTSGLTGNSPVPGNPNMEGTNASGTPKRVGIRCANGRAMVGISKGDEVCDNVELPEKGSWTAQQCPAGQWLKGLRTDGSIECTVW